MDVMGLLFKGLMPLPMVLGMLKPSAGILTTLLDVTTGLAGLNEMLLLTMFLTPLLLLVVTALLDGSTTVLLFSTVLMVTVVLGGIPFVSADCFDDVIEGDDGVLVLARMGTIVGVEAGGMGEEDFGDPA